MPVVRQQGFILGIVLILLSLIALYALSVAKMNWMLEQSQARFIHKTKHFYQIEKKIKRIAQALSENAPQAVGAHERQDGVRYEIEDLDTFATLCVCRGPNRYASHHYRIVATDEVFAPDAIAVRIVARTNKSCASKRSECIMPGIVSWSQQLAPEHLLANDQG